MVPRNERRVRGWSLTRRLAVALTAGAFFVALLLGFLGADRDRARADQDAAEIEQRLALALAERGAPLLEKGDVLRLSVLAAVVRDQAAGRALVLDRGGKVLIDTALMQADRQLGLISNGGTLRRAVDRGDGMSVRESVAAIRFGGEVIGEVRLQCEPKPMLQAFDAHWFGLTLLCCLTLVAAAALLGHHWSSRVRGATDAVIRLAAGEAGGAPTVVNESELQDFSAAVRELERGLNDGLARVGEGFVAMALQVVDGLERRRLCVPGHGDRTAALAGRLADRLQLSPADRHELELSCRLVDLGKASVRESILKKAQLSELEAQSLQHHPVRAAEQLDTVPALRRVAKIMRHQLERYDGAGAPDGLRGDRIPLGSRVLAIASAFDLLTTAGEQPLDWQSALTCLTRARGEVFDPALLDLFVAEVQKDPPPSAVDRDVTIVPGGLTPWRATPVDDDDDDDDDDDRKIEEAIVDELEVMSDEPRREEGP
jgi:HD-GYP domain-containing protein (c-di-GMP phosphodiesterase class II)